MTKPSGLRDPNAAMRGVGAAALLVEAVVLLLAIQPIRMLAGAAANPVIGVVAGLAVLAAVVAGLLGRGWAWWLGGVLQVALLAAGVLHWSLAVIGLVFGLVWWYVLHVRRRVLGERPG